MENINIHEEGHRIGLRLRCDKNVDPEVRTFCKDFTKWLRKEYFFPVRVPVYIKADYRIKAKDGEMVVGTFFRPYDYHTEPYARIATGDYQELVRKQGKEYAMWAILSSIAHELTHYFQYVNSVILTRIGEERQATMYSRYILSEYDAYLNNNKKEMYTNNIWKSCNWQKNRKFDVCEEGIRFYADKNIDENICKICKVFLKYLRKEYFFPVRVNVWIKNKLFITGMDGNKKNSDFYYKESDSNIIAYIVISLEWYKRVLNRGDEKSALIAILSSISYELTCYFQWINGLQLSVIGRKRQANKYAKNIVDEYLQADEYLQ